MVLFVIAVFVIILIVSSCSNYEKTKNSISKNDEMEKMLIEKGMSITKSYKLSIYDVSKGFYVDEKHQQIVITDNNLQTELSFDDILECEVIENGSVQKNSGVGRAIVGGALAGGVGAIIGSNTGKSYKIASSLLVKIITRNISNPIIQITLLNSSMKIDSPLYKRYREYADQVHAVLTIIIKSNSDAQTQNRLKSVL